MTTLTCSDASSVSAIVPNPYEGMYTSTDPILYQMLRPVDPIVQKSIEEMSLESLSNFWKNHKQIPSETEVGNFFDRLMGWGKFYKAAEKTDEVGSNYICKRGSLGKVVTENLVIGLNTTKNGSTCLIDDPRWYEVGLFGAPGDDVKQKFYCRIQKCINNFFSSCAPHCTPCEDNTACENVNEISDSIDDRREIRSKVIHLDWLITATGTYLNHCRTSRIFNTFEKIVHGCEQVERSRS